MSVWEKALAQITQQRPRIIVPGHGNLGGVEIANQVRNYFQEIRKLVASSKANKINAVKAVRQIELVVQHRHPTWERKEFIAPALRYLVFSLPEPHNS